MFLLYRIKKTRRLLQRRWDILDAGRLSPAWIGENAESCAKSWRGHGGAGITLDPVRNNQAGHDARRIEHRWRRVAVLVIRRMRKE